MTVWQKHEKKVAMRKRHSNGSLWVDNNNANEKAESNKSYFDINDYFNNARV
jgi:hypothetical protein